MYKLFDQKFQQKIEMFGFTRFCVVRGENVHAY